MTPDRIDQMLARLDVGEDAWGTLAGLCVECAREFDVTGAGIALIIDGTPRGFLGASDERSGAVEALQVALAEGPCLDAHNEREPVFEPLLAQCGRWTSFAPAAVAAGVQAVFSFPLQVGTARVGALDLYRSSPGPLGDQDRGDAQGIAALVTTLVLMTRAGTQPGPFSAG